MCEGNQKVVKLTESFFSFQFFQRTDELWLIKPYLVMSDRLGTGSEFSLAVTQHTISPYIKFLLTVAVAETSLQ